MRSNSKANLARVPLLVLVLALAAPGSASADPAAGKACASTLSPEGRMMFEAVAPKVKPDSVFKDAMQREVRGLILSGKLSPAVAQKNAAAVVACLKKLQG